MNLDTQLWKEYRLGDIFEIKKGKRLTAEDQTDGCTPYIGAIDSNNGIANYIGQNPIHKGNTISLSYNGSVGEAFYQPKDFWATDDVNVLYFRKENGIEFNRNIALFICTILKQEKYRYCYGRKWVLESMKETLIELPTKNGNPDWQWMDDYIKTLHYKQISTQKIETLPLKLESSKWKAFKFGNLIESKNIYKAKAYSKIELEISKIKKDNYVPFISRTEANNGLDCYVALNESIKLESGNAITIGDTTSTIAYQSESFTTGDHIIVIRANWLNKYTGMFIVALLKRERFRYSYGRAFLMESIKETQLLLPTTDNCTPDWLWMENYIKSLPYSDRI